VHLRLRHVPFARAVDLQSGRMDDHIPQATLRGKRRSDRRVQGAIPTGRPRRSGHYSTMAGPGISLIRLPASCLVVIGAYGAAGAKVFCPGADRRGKKENCGCRTSARRGCQARRHAVSVRAFKGLRPGKRQCGGASRPSRWSQRMFTSHKVTVRHHGSRAWPPVYGRGMRGLRPDYSQGRLPAYRGA
jgi:hypothetical protein